LIHATKCHVLVIQAIFYQSLFALFILILPIWTHFYSSLVDKKAHLSVLWAFIE